MQPEPSIFIRLFEFGSALLPYWWAILTSGIGPAMIIRVADKYQERAPRRFRPALRRLANPDARPWIILAIFVLGFGYASFSAFDGIEKQLHSKENELQQAHNKGSADQQKSIEQLRSELDQAKQQITSLSHPSRDPNQLYQDTAPVARIRGANIDHANGRIIFDVATSTDELDPTFSGFPSQKGHSLPVEAP